MPMSDIKSAKWCWIAHETKNGWRVALNIDRNRHAVSGVYFAFIKDVERVFGGKVVFVHLKQCKCPDYEKRGAQKTVSQHRLQAATAQAGRRPESQGRAGAPDRAPRGL